MSSGEKAERVASQIAMDGNGWKRGFIQIQIQDTNRNTDTREDMGFIAITRDETGLGCYRYMKKKKQSALPVTTYHMEAFLILLGN